MGLYCIAKCRFGSTGYGVWEVKIPSLRCKICMNGKNARLRKERPTKDILMFPLSYAKISSPCLPQITHMNCPSIVKRSSPYHMVECCS